MIASRFLQTLKKKLLGGGFKLQKLKLQKLDIHPSSPGLGWPDCQPLKFQLLKFQLLKFRLLRFELLRFRSLELFEQENGAPQARLSKKEGKMKEVARRRHAKAKKKKKEKRKGRAFQPKSLYFLHLALFC